MKTFKPNQIISCWSVGDHHITYTAKVVKRTAKTTTIRKPYNYVNRARLAARESCLIDGYEPEYFLHIERLALMDEYRERAKKE